MTRISSVSVIGLGKLGACIAAAMSAKGMRVVGVDTDPSNVELVNQGISPIFEPGLDQVMAAGRDQFSATTDLQEAVLNTDASFIVVPTPSGSDGRFSIEYVQAAAKNIGSVLRGKSQWHLIALISTVMPGDTESGVIPIIETASGKRCGVDFGVCYSPEFIALGTVVRDFLNPDFVLLGESDPVAGEALASIYASVCDGSPPIQRMNLVNAELAKLAVNTYITTKISFANTIADICEQIDGADVDVVTDAVGLDKRIGRRYLTGGAPFGGPCFPRDVTALTAYSQSIGVDPIIAEATASENLSRSQHLVQECLDHLPLGGAVGVLGLAYKPDTNVIDDSLGMFIASEIASKGQRVLVHDPSAMDIAKSRLQKYSESIRFCEDSQSCVQESDVVIITMPSEAYSNMPVTQFAREGSDRFVIDCWRVFRDRLPIDGVTYLPSGIKAPASHQ